MAAEAFSVAAPAKLNLYLAVIGRRQDSYHLIDSLVAFLALHDTLQFAPAAELSLKVAGPLAEALAGMGEDNLVLRAARALGAATGHRGGASITLFKRIPLAAGLGGGSADGAATLKALCRLWGLTVARDELARIGAGLGADLPVCLAGAPSFVGGIGEHVAPSPPLPHAWVVLVNPGAGLATADVFANRQGPFSMPQRFGAVPGDLDGLAVLLNDRGNDLRDSAQRLVPAIAQVLEALAEMPGCAYQGMSGSGATCFGLFAARRDAHAALDLLQARRLGWWINLTALLVRAPD